MNTTCASYLIICLELQLIEEIFGDFTVDVKFLKAIWILLGSNMVKEMMPFNEWVKKAEKKCVEIICYLLSYLLIYRFCWSYLTIILYVFCIERLEYCTCIICARVKSFLFLRDSLYWMGLNWRHQKLYKCFHYI